MSFFNTWILLASALVAPEGNFFPPHTRWMAENETQQLFLKKLGGLKEDMMEFNEQELQSWASQNADELNAIAREKEIPITFSPFSERTFGSLALLELNLAWHGKPAQTEMSFYAENILKVKGLEFNSDSFKVYQSRRHQFPVIKLKTKNGDFVYVTIADKKLNGVALSQRIKTIKKTLSRSKKHYTQMLMPQLAYESFIDISWLNEMKNNQDYMVSQAVEYLKLKVDEKGCAVKAGAGMVFIPISVQQPLTIDKPFYFWIERPGCLMPLVEGYIDQDAVQVA